MREVFSTATRLRVGLAAVVLFVNAVQGHGIAVLPWALLVVACDIVAGFLLANEDVLLPHRTRRAALGATVLSGFAAGLAFLAGPGALPLVLIPFFRAGERRKIGVVLTFAAVAMGAAVALLVDPTHALSMDQFLVWGLLAVVIGVLAAWEDRVVRPEPADPVAGEAAKLVARLAEISANLDGGLDPAMLAETVIDGLPEDPTRRSAVLIGQPGGHAMPLTLRGAVRVPWAQPSSDPAGIIGSAWCEGEVSYGFAGGRALVACPIVDTQGTQVGVLVTDRIADVGPDRTEVEAVRAAVGVHSPGLTVALAYAALREDAGLEERRELARTLHDGVAQEVAALGFQLDMIRFAAQAKGDSCAADLAELRGEVARILGDVRSNITDLRVGLRPETGLGSAISNRLQQFGTTTGAVVRVSLNESGFRLPPQTEIRLYRLLLDVLTDAHRHGAAHVDVELSVAAPHFALSVRHDGRKTTLRENRLLERLEGEPSARLDFSTDPAGTTVDVTAQPVEVTRPPKNHERPRLRVAS